MQFFEELPTRNVRRKSRVDWVAAKEEMLAHPNEWGLIATNISVSTPGQLRAGKYKHFQGDDLDKFEFSASRPETPDEPYAQYRTDLYGRYTA